MKNDYQPVLGYYYYSQQPHNSYYDHINKPIEIIHFEWIILLIFIICIMSSSFNYFTLIIKKKDN